jgi:hypothetical protein
MTKLNRRSLIAAALGFAPLVAFASAARARHVDGHTEEVNEREEDLPRKEVEARRKNRKRRRREREREREEVNEREVDMK